MIRHRPLAELTKKIGSGATPRGGAAVYQEEGTAFIRSQNVLDHSMRLDGLVRLSDDHAAALAGVAVQPGDVLINITGDSVARACVVTNAVIPGCVSQHVAILRPGPELDSRFLQAFLVSPSTKSHLLALSATGGTRKALTKEVLSRLQVPWRSLNTQRAIGRLLGALDDKIAANVSRRTLVHELLVASFSAVTMKWGIPDVPLGSLMDLCYGKALPTPLRAPGNIPVYGSGGIVGSHSNALVGRSGIVVGRKGTVGATHWVPSPHWPIDTTYYVESLRGFPIEYCYFLLLSVPLADMNADSAVPGLNRVSALRHKVRALPEERAHRFAAQARPLLESAAQAERESTKLAELRDTLLGPLMSGKLTIKDAQRVVEEVV